MTLRASVLPCLPFGALLSLLPGRALALDAVVDASTDAQFYQVRSSLYTPVVQRERFTQTLGLSLYDLTQTTDDAAPRVDAKLRLRVDADVGIEDAELDLGRSDRFVPGLRHAPFDVMYGYVEGSRFAGGVLGFRIGRQYTMGPLGFWSFDGALATVATPAYFAVDAFAGFEQRGGLPLSTSRFEADGVWRGDRTGFDGELLPEFLESTKLAPAYGFDVRSAGVEFLDARLSYRKVENRDVVSVSPGSTGASPPRTLSETRTSSERIGFAANASARALGAADLRGVYDFYVGRLSEHAAALTWHAADTLRVGAGYEYYLPTYDGDSIFNWFVRGGTTTARTRTSWEATRRLGLATSVGLRRFGVEGDAAEQGVQYDALASIEGKYRAPEGEVSLRAAGEAGDRGRLLGTDLFGVKRFDGDVFDLSALLSLYEFDDPLRPSRDAASFSYVLGGGVSPFSPTRAALSWEHSMNRLAGQRFRVLVSLDVALQ